MRTLWFMVYQSVNPYDGKLVKTFLELTDVQLDDALANASVCFESWRQTSFETRAAVLGRAASIMRSDVDQLARSITLEMGKRIDEARAEIFLSADVLDYYAQHAEEFLATQSLGAESGHADVENHPFGVLLGIEPWNYPYYQLARFAAPNLMAGNVVMIKPANCVPQCAYAFEKVWRKAGAPAGAYTNLLISYDQVRSVIEDPRVRGVAFTGCIEAGKIVAGNAGSNLKKSTMELGGSDAFIVLDDADLDQSVHWAIWGKMNNTGQSCVAPKRFIVVDELAERFLAKFSAGLRALTAGDPLDPSTTLGPLSTESALAKLVAEVDQAVRGGARIVLGGARIERAGAFMQPTILTDLSPHNPAVREGFFGPVALFYAVKDEAAAVALANDSDYGLGGAVFTRDQARGRRVASLLETGMVFVNRPTETSPELPFGGIKNSGYGRELSNLGVQQFVNKKLVRSQAARAGTLRCA